MSKQPTCELVMKLDDWMNKTDDGRVSRELGSRPTMDDGDDDQVDEQESNAQSLMMNNSKMTFGANFTNLAFEILTSIGNIIFHMVQVPMTGSKLTSLQSMMRRSF